MDQQQYMYDDQVVEANLNLGKFAFVSGDGHGGSIIMIVSNNWLSHGDIMGCICKDCWSDGEDDDSRTLISIVAQCNIWMLCIYIWSKIVFINNLWKQEEGLTTSWLTGGWFRL